VERHHNTTGNQPGVIACLELLIEVVPILLQLLRSRWARFSTLMVGIQQVVENNYHYMQLIISKLKVGSILYVIFIDTLATYLPCEVETTIPY
jgi:hypothetical protein